MITNFTWTDYFIGVAILLTIYYLFVAVRYYWPEVKELSTAKWNIRALQTEPSDRSGHDSFHIQETTDETTVLETAQGNEFAEVEELIGRLKSAIGSASQNKLIPQELKEYIHLVLLEYPNIKNSPMRASINELIASECEKYGAVTLSEEDVEMLWEEAM